MSSGERHTVSAEAFPKRSERVLWREVDGDAVLFREDDGRAFALNGTAARVWRLCDGDLSVRRIAELLGETYGTDGTLDAVAALVKKLHRDGCVDIESIPDGGTGPETDGASPPPPQAWREPVMEEIVFAACDCSAGPRGTMKISLCTGTSPKSAQS
jgi:hypothetical protein